MLVGAAIPSVSTLTVAARSVSYGLSHGLLTSLGIVAGDILFILIAIYGLTLLSDWLGEHFTLVRYLGGMYLIWLGIVLWRRPVSSDLPTSDVATSRFASFASGLLITLADQKAILFYLGFFPAFLNLSIMSVFDTMVIVFIAFFAVGLPKVAYAIAADRAARIITHQHYGQRLNQFAGSIMILIGLYLIIGS